MPQGVVEEKDRQPGSQQRDDVGDDEGTAAVGVGHPWEAPDVSQADRRADGGDEEAARTARRVEDKIPIAGIQHAHHHVTDVARGEELTSVTTKVGTDHFFVGFTLDINVRVEQGEHLQLCHNVGQHLSSSSICSLALKIWEYWRLRCQNSLLNPGSSTASAL